MGYHATHELVRRGHEVTVWGLPPAPAADLLPDSVVVQLLDVAAVDDRQLRELLAAYDAIVFAAGADDRAVPAEPALLVVEIVSPSDSHSALIRKLEDYRAWGAEHIWVIDPELRRLSVYRLEGLIHVARLELAELEIVLGPADLFE